MRLERLVLILLAILVTKVPANGQLLSFGIKAGGEISTGLDFEGMPFAVSEAKPYTFGPAVEFRLPFKLAVEVDALYNRTGYRGDLCRFTYCWAQVGRTNVFAFPALLKYRLFRGPLSPYVAGGPAYRHVGGPSGTVLNWRTGPAFPGEVVDTTVQRTSLTGPGSDGAGVVVGGGLEIKLGILKLSPEYRFTHWNNRAWGVTGSGDGYYFNGSSPNQHEILLGVMF
jgi:hypothetical protein